MDNLYDDTLSTKTYYDAIKFAAKAHQNQKEKLEETFHFTSNSCCRTIS